MLSLLYESAGDMTLKKFIVIFTPRVAGVEEANSPEHLKYSDALKCYYIIWNYKYNWITLDCDMSTIHQELFEVLPEELVGITHGGNTYVGNTTTITGREKVVIVVGDGGPIKDRKMKLFTEKVCPEASDYTLDKSDAFDISLRK